MVHSVTKTILFGHMGLELLDHMDEYIAELKLKEPVVEDVVEENVVENVVLICY